MKLIAALLFSSAALAAPPPANVPMANGLPRAVTPVAVIDGNGDQITAFGGGAGSSVATSRNLYIATSPPGGGRTDYAGGDLLDRVVTSTSSAVVSAYWIDVTTGTLLTAPPVAGSFAQLSATQATLAAILAADGLATDTAWDLSATSASIIAVEKAAALKMEAIRAQLVTGTTSVNNAQIGGAVIATGAGTSNAGTQRIVTSSDSAITAQGVFSASAGLTAGTAPSTMPLQSDAYGNLRTDILGFKGAPTDAANSYIYAGNYNTNDTVIGTNKLPLAAGMFMSDGTMVYYARGNAAGLFAQGNVSDGGTDAGNSLKMGAQYGSGSLTAYSTGQRVPLQADNYGNFRAGLALVPNAPFSTGTQAGWAYTRSSGSTATTLLIPLETAPEIWTGNAFVQQLGGPDGSSITRAPSSTPTQQGGTIATSGGTATVTFVNTNDTEVINPAASGGAVLWAYPTTPTVGGANSWAINPGGSYRPPNRVAGTLTLLSTTASQPYTATRF